MSAHEDDVTFYTLRFFLFDVKVKRGSKRMDVSVDFAPEHRIKRVVKILIIAVAFLALMRIETGHLAQLVDETLERIPDGSLGIFEPITRMAAMVVGAIFAVLLALWVKSFGK